MCEEGPLCRIRRRLKYRSYMGQVGKPSPNLLACGFKAGGTKLYLSPVVDLYNDEVVSYSISRSPNMEMVLEMMAGLEGRLDGGGAPLLHLEMGSQYQMLAYGLALERMEIAQSMPRKGNCFDNAKAENFFSVVKTEFCCDWEGCDPGICERDLGKCIYWYNNARIKKRLDGSSPLDVREMGSFTDLGCSS